MANPLRSQTVYKYPQRAFPYAEMIETNRARSKTDPEFELIDTGIFDDDRYWDVEIAYAKGGPNDTLLWITAHNRGPEAAEIALVPQLWFRNTWSWCEKAPKPVLRAEGPARIRASHPELPDMLLVAEGERQHRLGLHGNHRRAGGSQLLFDFRRQGQRPDIGRTGELVEVVGQPHIAEHAE